MAVLECVVIKQGGLTTCPPDRQLPFEASETLRIGWRGYSAVEKEVIACRNYEYEIQSTQTCATLNEVRNLLDAVDYELIWVRMKTALRVRKSFLHPRLCSMTNCWV